MSITRINEFQAAEEMTESAFEFLQSILPHITSSEGCQSCELLCDINDPDKFLVIEKWDSVDAHLASIAAFPEDRIQAAAGLFAQMPTGAYYQA